MRKTIGGMNPIGRCVILSWAGKPFANWPYFLKDGVWCLTPHYTSSKNGPDWESEWFTVTHLPTGYRAAEVRVDDPRKAQKLAKFSKMFGAAKTQAGVMRKYRSLPDHQVRWIKMQVSWLLPSKSLRNKSAN